MTIILRTIGLGTLEVGVVGCRDRNMVRNRVTADDKATGVNTCASHRTLEHLGIFDGIGEGLVRRSFRLTQFRHILDGIGKVHLRALAIRTVWQTIGNSLTKGIGDRKGHLLDAGHILDGVLRGHCGVGNDMGTILVTILIFHPFQHLTAPIVIEVGIDIRERDTVRIEETLKQQIVLQGVDLRDA